MKPETLQLLQTADDAVEWEAPRDFDYREAMRRVHEIKVGLEQLLGVPLELDEYVQDAAFFTTLGWHKPGKIANQTDAALAIRFSNFGRLFTLWSHGSTDQLLSDAPAQFIEIAERHGFIYVSVSDLEEPYTGPHPAFKSGSWWLRFFDYV